MESKEYVLNHDFGYGWENKVKEINKIKLRKFEDLKIYLDDVLENCFINYEQGSFRLTEKNIKMKIEFEEL